MPTSAAWATPRSQAARIARELASLAFALPGTLADRMTRCGYPDLPLSR